MLSSLKKKKKAQMPAGRLTRWVFYPVRVSTVAEKKRK
jgi:hypothetical protein